MKKKIIALAVLLGMMMICLAGCANSGAKEPEKPYSEMNFEEKREASEKVLLDFLTDAEIVFTTETWTIETETHPHVFTKWFNVEGITVDDIYTASFTAGANGEPFGLALVVLKDSTNIEEIAKELADKIYIERWDSEGANLKVAHTVDGNFVFITIVGEAYEHLFTAESLIELYHEVT